MGQQLQFPRGSEWRKWDPQVHTPFSALNNGFGADFDAYAKELFIKIASKKIAVVGITDYFCIEGYKNLRSLLADPSRVENLVGKEVARVVSETLFLPNIELRTSIIVRNRDGTDSRVNFHVIFADNISVQNIEENFLRELKFTAQGSPGTPDEQWALTIANLTELGRRLKTEHSNFRSHTDLYVGMMNAVISDSDVVAVARCVDTAKQLTK